MFSIKPHLSVIPVFLILDIGAYMSEIKLCPYFSFNSQMHTTKKLNIYAILVYEHLDI